jgi:quercetin dioxygenase-like cupin family protein
MPNDPISVGALTVRFVADAEATGGAASVFECEVPARAQMPAPHSHDGFDEIIYGLRGVTTFTVDGREVEVGAGDAVVIPRGAVHGFQNRGEADAAVLAVTTPGVFHRAYFEEIGAVLAAAAGGPPDRAAIAAVMARHGLSLATVNV